MAKATLKVAEVTPSGEIKPIVLDAKQDLEERMNRLVKGAFISSDDLANEMAVISKNYSRETAAAQIDSILKKDIVRLKKIEGKVTMNLVRDLGLLRNNYLIKSGNEKSGEKDFRKWVLDNHVVESQAVFSQYKKVFESCFDASGRLLPEYEGVTTYNKAYLLADRSSEEIEKWKNLPDAKIKAEIKKADKAAEAVDKAAEAADKAAEAAEKTETAEKPQETSPSFDIPMMKDIDSVFEVLNKAAEADKDAALYIMRRAIDLAKTIGTKYSKD